MFARPFSSDAFEDRLSTHNPNHRETNIDFHHHTASKSSIGTLNSNDDDPIEDFIDITAPSFKKRKTKE